MRGVFSRIDWVVRRRRQLAKTLPGFWASTSSFVDGDSRFEGYNQVYRGARLLSSALGLASYLAEGARVSNCTMGRYCSIGHQAMVGGLGKHPVDRLGSHPAFYSAADVSGLGFGQASDFAELPRTVIGNDVWIGARAIVLDGMRVGDGAIIGAGAIVTRDVEPYAVVAGSPARLIRYRFSPEIVCELLDWAWWSFPVGQVGKIARALAARPLTEVAQVRQLRAAIAGARETT